MSLKRERQLWVRLESHEPAAVSCQSMKKTAPKALPDVSSVDAEVYNVSPIDRAINILEVFSESQLELTLTEIVGMSGLHKATTFRLLNALRRRHLVIKDESSGRYRLGLRLTAFAEVAKAGNNFLGQARATMLDLRNETRQTIYLSVRKGDYRFDIEQFPGLNETRLVIAIGEPKLLEVGAAGRVMLAALSDAEVEGYLERTRKLRRPTTNVAALRREIASVRGSGFAESRGHGGLTAVAAALHGTGNVFLGTMSMTLSLEMFEREHTAMAKVLVSRAKRLSAELGATPPV